MERKAGLKTRPLLLHYYITNRCNSRCTFCQIWQEFPKYDAELKQVEVNLKHAWNNGCTFVDFTGGEPLLHKDLPEFLRIARKIGFITSVTTNCILFPKRAKELAGAIDLLHFSLDADNKEQHDTMHGSRSFDFVLESIGIARSHKLTPDILFTYSNKNIDSFEGIIQLAQHHKIMALLDPVFSLNGVESISPVTHQKAQTFSRHRGVYLNKAHLVFRSSGANRIRYPLCKSVESTVVLLPDNRLALPCFHHRSLMVPIDNNLSNILKSNARREALEHQGLYSFCEGCHINCYFDPSYSRMLNRLFFLSNSAKLSYVINKYVYYGNHFPLSILRAFIKQWLNRLKLTRNG